MKPAALCDMRGLMRHGRVHCEMQSRIAVGRLRCNDNRGSLVGWMVA